MHTLILLYDTHHQIHKILNQIQSNPPLTQQLIAKLQTLLNHPIYINDEAQNLVVTYNKETENINQYTKQIWNYVHDKNWNQLTQVLERAQKD